VCGLGLDAARRPALQQADEGIHLAGRIEFHQHGELDIDG
jgi:hypothetical protein